MSGWFKVYYPFDNIFTAPSGGHLQGTTDSMQLIKRLGLINGIMHSLVLNKQAPEMANFLDQVVFLLQNKSTTGGFILASQSFDCPPGVDKSFLQNVK